MTGGVANPVEVALAIERAAAEYRRLQEVEEAKCKGPRVSFPLPTKEEAWQAWAHAALDRDGTIGPESRREFEEWWG